MSTTYGLFSRGEYVEKIQRALNEKLNLRLGTDGDLGKITLSAIESFQKLNGISETANGRVIYGPKTDAILGPYIEKRFLTESDFVKAAAALNVPILLVKAVTAVEAKKYGFQKNGFPTTLFERHKFYQALTRHKGSAFANSISAKQPDICNPTAGGYLGGTQEEDRLGRARVIHEAAGLESASYGLFQIMGFNYKATGFTDAVGYFNSICVSEDNQMTAFVNFLKAAPTTLAALRARNYDKFAEGYNGSNYREGGYHTKIKDEFDRLVKLNGMVVS